MGQTKHPKQVATVMHSINDPVFITHASLDTDVFSMWDPILKTTFPWVKNKRQSNMYYVATTPINYHQLSVELKYYPFELDRQLLTGFKIVFSSHYLGPMQYRISNNLQSAQETLKFVEDKSPKELYLGR